MSNAILNRAYLSTVTNSTDMAVLASLADQANKEAICWPSVGTISRRTRLVERTVQKALRRLTKEGHISVTGSIDGGSRRQTPTYVVHPVQAAVTGAGDSPESSLSRKETPVNPRASVRAESGAHTHASEGTSVILDVDPLPKKLKEGAGELAVEWDGTEFRVPAELLAQWRKAFPALNVAGCIREAAMWVIDHPSRSRKKPGARFLEGWLRRTRPRESPPADDGADPLPRPEPPPPPDGWERAWEAMYGDPPDLPWVSQIDDVQLECRQWLKKHERGAT
jgi:hypothetical protein